MPSLKDIRKRIGSVKNTQKITKAMKMVAAAKLRRAQDAITAARPYAVKLLETVSPLAAKVEDDAHPLLAKHDPSTKAHVIIITSDRGLCGGFNSTIIRAVDSWIREKQANNVDVTVTVIGKKGDDYFSRRDFAVEETMIDVLSAGVSFEQARKVGDRVIEKYVDGQYHEVYVAFNEFRSAISQEQRIIRLLPIDTSHFEDNDNFSEFEFEPERETLLEVLLPKYVKVQIHRALLESAASEQGSRMTAMDNATNNASDMIAKLTLQYNRARQAAITKELVEITSGAEALG